MRRAHACLTFRRFFFGFSCDILLTFFSLREGMAARKGAR